MKCPICELDCIPQAKRCECGYRFPAVAATLVPPGMERTGAPVPPPPLPPAGPPRMEFEPVHLSAPGGPSRQMVVGLLWLLGGIAITVFTYSAAASSPGGGRYVFAYGPMIYGAITFVRGLGDMTRR